MENTGQKTLLAGALMLAAGFTLPYFVGPAIAPWGYDLLQIVGIVALIVGFRVRARNRKERAGGGSLGGPA